MKPDSCFHHGFMYLLSFLYIEPWRLHIKPELSGNIYILSIEEH